jgi:glucokinase
MSLHIAVDIGGTQMRAACYAPDSLDPLKLKRISTHDPHTTALERLQDLIASIWPDVEPVAAIGVAAPGPLDPYKGILFSAPNIPGWEELHLRQHLEDRFKVPVALGNDANLAALGEWHFGAGKGHHHMIYLTISTGIGSGIIVDDHLLLGQRGLAAELGHVTVLPNGPLCGCGRPGHLEALASGTAIADWVRTQIAEGATSSQLRGAKLSAKMVAQAAGQGDQLATAALARAGSYIGQALAGFLHSFNPSAVVFGGGVSQSGPFLFDPMRASLERYVMSPHYLKDLTMTTAVYGDQAGLVGALALARTHKFAYALE